MSMLCIWGIRVIKLANIGHKCELNLQNVHALKCISLGISSIGCSIAKLRRIL